jgi:hypothetical protein
MKTKQGEHWSVIPRTRKRTGAMLGLKPKQFAILVEQGVFKLRDLSRKLCVICMEGWPPEVRARFNKPD